jgi:phosphohistidine phosphatase
MLELLLIRHAKSAWDVAAIPDHDRDLAPRGTKAARRIGVEMAARRLTPELALCSTATRARRTWELISETLPGEVPVHWLRSLYLAAPSRLLGLIRRQPESIRRLAVIAHDPGMHALATRLVREGERTELDALEAKFPTGAVALISFEKTSWGEVGEQSGRLLAFIRPRDLD